MQSGQVVQPRPDSLSRTAPPVQMIRAEVTTPASASLRITSSARVQQNVGQRPEPARHGDVRLWLGGWFSGHWTG